MTICKNKHQHTGRYCGSHAVNNDPERKLCDVCYAYDAGLEAAAEICDSAGDAIENMREEDDEDERIRSSGCYECAYRIRKLIKEPTT